MNTWVARMCLAIMSLTLVECSGGSGCKNNDDCKANEVCNPSSGKCLCVPNCTDKCCGSDGCGGDCPDNCGDDHTCVNCSCQQDSPACNDGVKRCENNWAEICLQGSWNQISNCTLLTQTCIDGECVDPGVAHPGAGDVCRCESPDSCSIACPADVGDANICVYEEGSDGFCTYECLVDQECSIDFENGCCQTISNSKVCMPKEVCPGSGTAGAACPFSQDGVDIVNADADNCAAGYYCLGVSPSEENGTCEEAAECSTIFSVYNRDCVSGKCGYSFCAMPCSAQDTCSDESTEPVQTTSGDCICAPSTVGDVPANQPCESPATPDAGYCQADLTCIFNDAVSFCSNSCESTEECTTDFPEGCCAEISGGSSYCMPSSFCS